jgi:hypothetical protein
MATVINNPGTSTESTNTSGAWMGIIILIVAILGLLYFFMPYFRGGTPNVTPSVQNNTNEAPPADQGTDINIPDKVDVNVNDGRAPQ